MESLRNCSGNDIPRPEKVIVTNWNVDEHIRGACSFNQAGMKRWDRHLLPQPIGKDQLYISGEATHEDFLELLMERFL